MQGIPVVTGTAEGPALLLDDERPEFDRSWALIGVGTAKGIERAISAGVLPAGMILTERPPPALGQLPQVPAVGGVDADLFRTGERIRLDGEAGTVQIERVEEVPVVTSLLQDENGRILLLRRSEVVSTFRGLWAGVSGFLEDPTPLDGAKREILEETGLTEIQLKLRASGALVYVRHADKIYAIHPFLFGVSHPEIRINEEHSDYAWVDPAEIPRRPTPPKLERVWENLTVAASERGQK